MCIFSRNILFSGSSSLNKTISNSALNLSSTNTFTALSNKFKLNSKNLKKVSNFHSISPEDMPSNDIELVTGNRFIPEKKADLVINLENKTNFINANEKNNLSEQQLLSVTSQPIFKETINSSLNYFPLATELTEATQYENKNESENYFEINNKNVPFSKLKETENELSNDNDPTIENSKFKFSLFKNSSKSDSETLNLESDNEKNTINVNITTIAQSEKVVPTSHEESRILSTLRHFVATAIGEFT